MTVTKRNDVKEREKREREGRKERGGREGREEKRREEETGERRKKRDEADDNGGLLGEGRGATTKGRRKAKRGRREKIELNWGQIDSSRESLHSIWRLPNRVRLTPFKTFNGPSWKVLKDARRVKGYLRYKVPVNAMEDAQSGKESIYRYSRARARVCVYE